MLQPQLLLIRLLPYLHLHPHGRAKNNNNKDKHHVRISFKYLRIAAHIYACTEALEEIALKKSPHVVTHIRCTSMVDL